MFSNITCGAFEDSTNSDASLANKTDNSTQGGFLIGLSQNDENLIPLAW